MKKEFFLMGLGILLSCSSIPGLSGPPEIFASAASPKKEAPREFPLYLPEPDRPEVLSVYPGMGDLSRGEIPMPEAVASLRDSEYPKQKAPVKTFSPVKRTPPPVKRTPPPVKKTPEPAQTAFAADRSYSGGAQTDRSNPDRVSDSLDPILASPGDNVELSLSRGGWIFTGFSGRRGLDFLSREETGTNTRFVFLAKDTGDYYLKFLLQDNFNGTVENERFLVRVADRAVPEKTTAPVAVVKEEASGEESGGIDRGDSLFESGKYTSALREYLKEYDPESEYLNDRIASIYNELENPEVAQRYWEKNLDKENPYRDRAVEGIVGAAVDREDLDTVLKFITDLFIMEKKGDPGWTAEITRFLEKHGKVNLSIRLILDFLERNPRGSAELYYLLGKFYRQDSPLRDLKKSRSYFTRVCEEYSESDYADPSLDEVKYLDRHFLYLW